MQIKTNAGTTAATSWSYPYNLKGAQIQLNNGSGSSVSGANDIKPSAEFFVFVGVMAMLFSLAFLIVYVVLDRQYRNDERFPIVDLFITLIWTIFWFASSSAWAKGVSNIRSQTSTEAIGKRSNICPNTPDCQEVQSKI